MKVSIIGAAGTLGSATAYYLATHGLCDELVLFDISRNHLLFHVKDIETAISGLNNTIVREGKEDRALQDSDVVIMTASMPYRAVTTRREYLFENLDLIKTTAAKIKTYCPEAIVITATNPIDPLNYAMYLTVGSARERFIGYSLNDTMRFRMIAAHYLGCKTTALSGLVIGEHGESMVPLFSTLAVDRKPVPVDYSFKEQVKRELSNVLNSLNSLNIARTTGWTSSVGLSAIVKAIKGDSGVIIPCSAILAGEYGAANISIGVPAAICRRGVGEIVQLELDPEEREALNQSIGVQINMTREIEKALLE
ncbi:MAG: hypothetical protein GX044_04675 [Firmicutes bacterium]|nr:hypothetical protein [Bacillota bacterium]